MSKNAQNNPESRSQLVGLSAAFDAKVEEVRKEEPRSSTLAPPKAVADASALPEEQPRPTVENAKWYIMQAYSGFEKRVKQLIEDHLPLHPELAEKVEEVFVPGESVVRVKNGRKRNTHVIYFPGYVLIKMDINDHLWHFLMNIPRVSGFIGGKDGKPKPLGEEELNSIRNQISEGVRQASIKEEFEVGQRVTVVEGPFANFSGLVDEVNTEKAKLRVMISILGRNTPVELGFTQVRAQTEN